MFNQNNPNKQRACPRIKCLIHNCKRTRKNEGELFIEWICQKHWSVVPKHERNKYTLAKKQFKKGILSDDEVGLVWERCKEQAYMNAWSV